MEIEKKNRFYKNNRQTGSDYEKAAADYLEKNGYQILERNYRNKCGEIDIIAYDQEKKTLVYIEIKYRSTLRCGDPLEAVDLKKRKRIFLAASYHYAISGYKISEYCRFDVIAFYGDKKIQHIKNAFDWNECR